MKKEFEYREVIRENNKLLLILFYGFVEEVGDYWEIILPKY
jgi:hypothetical protein